MRNKIDILRALCFDKEDLETITNIDGLFTDLEIEFMIEFKKVFELGEEYLKNFIDKLDSEGSELKIWDVEYYVEHLYNSPWGAKVAELAKDKKYFPAIPNILGTMGNTNVTRHNTSLHQDDTYPTDVSLDVYIKSPDFVRSLITKSQEITEKMFRTSLYQAIYFDNTLPLSDKNPKNRYSIEKSGAYTQQSNGSYCVRDVAYRIDLNSVRLKIFDKVKETIGEENFKMFANRKSYNPFEKDQNTAFSSIFEIEKNIKNGDLEQIIVQDIMGDPFDKRDSVIKVDNPEKAEEFVLNTVDGQLGN